MFFAIFCKYVCPIFPPKVEMLVFASCISFKSVSRFKTAEEAGILRPGMCWIIEFSYKANLHNISVNIIKNSSGTCLFSDTDNLYSYHFEMKLCQKLGRFVEVICVVSLFHVSAR